MPCLIPPKKPAGHQFAARGQSIFSEFVLISGIRCRAWQVASLAFLLLGFTAGLACNLFLTPAFILRPNCHSQANIRLHRFPTIGPTDRPSPPLPCHFHPPSSQPTGLLQHGASLLPYLPNLLVPPTRSGGCIQPQPCNRTSRTPGVRLSPECHLLPITY